MQRERTYFYEVSLQLDSGEVVIEVELPDGASEDLIYNAAVTELVSQCSYAKLGYIRKGGSVESFKEISQ